MITILQWMPVQFCSMIKIKKVLDIGTAFTMALKFLPQMTKLWGQNLTLKYQEGFCYCSARMGSLIFIPKKANRYLVYKEILVQILKTETTFAIDAFIDFYGKYVFAITLTCFATIILFLCCQSGFYVLFTWIFSKNLCFHWSQQRFAAKFVFFFSCFFYLCS